MVPLKLGSGGQPGTMLRPGAKGKIGLPVSAKRRTYQISATMAKITAKDANARIRRGWRQAAWRKTQTREIAPSKAKSLVANPQARKSTPAATHLNSDVLRQRRVATSDVSMKNVNAASFFGTDSAQCRTGREAASITPAQASPASAPHSRARIQAASSDNVKNIGATNWVAGCPPKDHASANKDSAACGKNE